MGTAERADQVGIEDRLQKSSVSRSSSANGIGAGVAGVPALLTRKSSRPQRVDRAARHRFGFARLRDVAGGGDHLVAEPLQPLDLLGTTRIVGQMVQRDGRAAAGKRLDRGEPDAGGAAS